MNLYSKCPYCGERAINAVWKVALVKAVDVRCDKCGKSVRLTRWSNLILLLLVVVFAFLGKYFIGHKKEQFLAFIYIVVFIVTLILSLMVLPLRKTK